MQAQLAPVHPVLSLQVHHFRCSRQVRPGAGEGMHAARRNSTHNCACGVQGRALTAEERVGWGAGWQACLCVQRLEMGMLVAVSSPAGLAVFRLLGCRSDAPQQEGRAYLPSSLFASLLELQADKARAEAGQHSERGRKPLLETRGSPCSFEGGP